MGAVVGSELVGETDGDVVGSAVVGEMVGDAVGSEVVGETVGEVVGSEVVGEAVGDVVGSEVVGETDGEAVGSELVGGAVGDAVGDAEQCAVITTRGANGSPHVTSTESSPSPVVRETSKPFSVLDAESAPARKLPSNHWSRRGL